MFSPFVVIDVFVMVALIEFTAQKIENNGHGKTHVMRSLFLDKDRPSSANSEGLQHSGNKERT